MTEDARMCTPPPTKGSAMASDLTKTPDVSILARPTTPARKTKQQFVFELWSLLSGKLQPMVSLLKHDADDEKAADVSVSDDSDDVVMVESTEPTVADSSEMAEASSGVDFAAVTQFIRDPSVMECASRFWAVLTSFVRCRRLQKGKMRAEMKEARILLSTLVIAMFPRDTLDIADANDIDDPMSEAVYIGAKDVIREVLVNAPSDVRETSKLRCDEAAKTMEDFLSAFECWRRKDKSKVLASLKNLYEEWLRSREVLLMSSMNELQRNAVLETVELSIENTRKRMLRLVGAEETEYICGEIEERLKSEEPHIHSAHHLVDSASGRKGAPTPSVTPATSFIMEDRSSLKMPSTASASALEPSAASATVADKLRAAGIPSKMRSGLLTPSASRASASESLASLSAAAEAKGSEEPTVINLDEIVTEESAKKYWADFAAEIEEGKFHRLFELLSELLSRLKRISPARDCAHLDEVIDVEFLRQSIEHGSIDAMGFYSIFDALWTQMSRIHAPAFDSHWKQWHDSVVTQMSQTDASWTKLLPHVLNKLLCKCDQIEDAIAEMRPLLKASSKHKREPATK